MSYDFDKNRDAPLPANLKDAIIEIRNLRRIMYSERQLLAKIAESREKDNRANAGNIKALKDENTGLRTELKKAFERVHELEAELDDIADS